MNTSHHNSEILENLMDRNRKYDFILKSGKNIRGVIIGYCLDDIEDPQSAVKSWHVVDLETYQKFGIECYAMKIGHFINQSEIATIQLLEDAKHAS